MARRDTERADRILDAAADLLTRWGYRKVTVDEVARRADVGKGTVYLHWRSRDALLFAVLLREGVATFDELARGMRADPGEVLLHRYVRAVFLQAMRRPLLAAIYTRDAEVLGRLIATDASRGVVHSKITLSTEYLALLAEHGLLRADLPVERIAYGIGTAVLGHLSIDPMLPPELAMTDEVKADLLAEMVRRSFEPAEAPNERAPGEVAPKITGIVEQLRDTYLEHIYGSTNGEE
ncbi:TetR/AcrR family transcriptional regulator [Saccharopolyspora sp. HNM0983]|uniref:TetR/AcrR family transcriptional regulator n=1 Tax=Saccharopolyspora montiporae TaxID=2781240 RepID=A0A929B9C5_9PSEU|nr:TetR/AcrR family transcriptional regulator [Saccharopolyspora sp. HNM0983]MBE9373948.1 TetR/AcrR family transcriptional regulator [Saccharopolyspora sp. HNM0983]